MLLRFSYFCLSVFFVEIIIIIILFMFAGSRPGHPSEAESCACYRQCGRHQR